MADQNLLTIFIAVTALAVLIQTGIMVGFYYVSTKLTRQADQALNMAQDMVRPLQTTIETLHDVTMRLSSFSAATQGQLRRLENWWARRAA
jgi:hypothetical protein